MKLNDLIDDAIGYNFVINNKKNIIFIIFNSYI